MIKKLLIAALLVLAAAGGFLLRQSMDHDDATAASGGGAAADTATQSAADAATPVTVAFTLPDLEGNMRDFSEWDGKARIVNFWATWCAPCRREIPLLKKTQQEFAASGLQIIGIAVDFTDDVIAYAQDAEFNYPILVGQEDAMAVAESSGVQFIGLPFTMVVAPGGQLLSVHLGEIHEPEIRSIVEQLGALQRGETSFAVVQAALKAL